MLSRLTGIGTLTHLRNSSGIMFGLSALMFGFRLIKRIAGDEPEVVYSGRLEPGQQLVITHTHETR